jgi:DNA-binding NtrC family response regulator
MLNVLKTDYCDEMIVAPVTFEFGMTLADVERAVIMETLKRQNFNRTRAARVLGIGIRTLQRKLKQYGSQLGVPTLIDA